MLIWFGLMQDGCTSRLGLGLLPGPELRVNFSGFQGQHGVFAPRKLGRFGRFLVKAGAVLYIATKPHLTHITSMVGIASLFVFLQQPQFHRPTGLLPQCMLSPPSLCRIPLYEYR